MNKKGSTAFVYFMVGILFFILGLALAPALIDTTNEVRNSDNLDCDNSSISNQNKAICFQVDSISPMWIGLMFGFAGIILTRLL